jgi:serine/threonine-protein kinase
VLDFGVGKSLGDGDALHTRTGVLVGSPAYMSPEQANGTNDVDARADLWSLGVVLFEMLAGRRPFPARAPYVAISEVLTAPIPSLSDELRGVPGLSDVVARCLTRDREARIGSADELARALRPFGDDLHATGEAPARGVLEAPVSTPALEAPAEVVEPPTTTEVIRIVAVTPVAAEVPGGGVDAPTFVQQSTASDVAATKPRDDGEGHGAATIKLSTSRPAVDDDDLRATMQQGRPVVAPGLMGEPSPPPVVQAPITAPSALLPRSPPRARLGALAGGLLGLSLVLVLLIRALGGAPSAVAVERTGTPDSAAPREAAEPPADVPATAGEPDPPPPPPPPRDSSEPVAEPSASATASPNSNWWVGKTRLAVTSTVTARVFVDGDQVGVTPLAPIAVRPGKHRVVFKHTLLGERSVAVQVKAGELKQVAMDYGARPVANDDARHHRP